MLCPCAQAFLTSYSLHIPFPPTPFLAQSDQGFPVSLSFTSNIWKFSKCAPAHFKCHILNGYGLPCSSWRVITIMNWQPVRALSIGTEMAQRDLEMRRQQTAGSSVSDVFTENKA